MNIPFFVISVNAKPRNEYLIEQLELYGLDVKLIQGIDGNLFTLDNLNETRLIDLNKLQNKYDVMPSVNELCCAIAHKDVINFAYQNLLRIHSNWIAVLEDDVEITYETIELITSLNNIFTYDYSSPCIITLYADSYICKAKPSIEIQIKETTFKMYECLVPPSSAVCYMLNKQAIKQISSVNNLISDKSDWPSIYSCFMDFKLVQPEAVSTSQFPSQIESYFKNRFYINTSKLNLINLAKYYLHKTLKIKAYENFREYFLREWKTIFLYCAFKLNKKKIIQKGYW